MLYTVHIIYNIFYIIDTLYDIYYIEKLNALNIYIKKS